MLVVGSGIIAAVLAVAGATAVFRAARPGARLRGLAALALGGVLLVGLAAPDATTALVTATISATTLAGLLAVAGMLERRATRDGGDELDLSVDPLRWR